MTRLSVAIDSNLLLLLIVGSASREYIAKHKRLKSFDSSDFDLLREQLSVASAIVLTPNTLTETSNLIDHIGEGAQLQSSAGRARIEWRAADAQPLRAEPAGCGEQTEPHRSRKELG